MNTTRQALLDSFLLLGAKDGLRSVSIGNLTQSVNISKSTFYSHFSSRDEVMEASINQAIRALEAQDIKLKLEQGDPEKSLYDCFEDFYNMFKEKRTGLLYRIIRSQWMLDPWMYSLNKRLETMACTRAQVVLDYLDQKSKIKVNDTKTASRMLGSSILDLLDEVHHDAEILNKMEDVYFSEAESFIAGFVSLFT